MRVSPAPSPTLPRLSDSLPTAAVSQTSGASAAQQASAGPVDRFEGSSGAPATVTKDSLHSKLEGNSTELLSSTMDIMNGRIKNQSWFLRLFIFGLSKIVPTFIEDGVRDMILPPLQDQLENHAVAWMGERAKGSKTSFADYTKAREDVITADAMTTLKEVAKNAKTAIVRNKFADPGIQDTVAAEVRLMLPEMAPLICRLGGLPTD